MLFIVLAENTAHSKDLKEAHLFHLKPFEILLTSNSMRFYYLLPTGHLFPYLYCKWHTGAMLLFQYKAQDLVITLS